MNIGNIYFQIFLLASSSIFFHVLSAPSYEKSERTHIAVSAKRTTHPKPVNCSAFPGAIQPGNLKNSDYYLLMNGSICCSLLQNCPSSDQDMLEECGSRGIVDDPCIHCKTCGKSKGEACLGHQYKLGRCTTGLSCININGTELEHQYEEGVCTNPGGPPSNLKPGRGCLGKFGYLGTCEPESRCNLKQDKDSGICVKYAKTMALNQVCGGRYGRLGRCAEGLRCTAEEDEFLKGVDIQGVCYKNSTDVCFKDCSTRSTESVCGDNGVWYDNICYLRQRNCPLLPHEGKIRKSAQQSSCGTKPVISEISTGHQSGALKSNKGAP